MTQTKGCKTCKKTTMKNQKLVIIIFGFYIFFSSVYGTITLAKEIINLFK